jgi:septal ring-binding cell division protein DamX
MINHDLIEELSGLLNLDTQESGRLLYGLFTAMVTELLAARKLTVKGLGSFTVSHLPLKKISNASGITYSPPCNRLTFDSRISRADDTASIAAAGLSLNTLEAERLGRAFAVVFSKAVKQQRDIRINGLGRFSKEEGAYGFIPERSIEVLLNREYQNLEDIVLPQYDTALQVRNESKKIQYATPLSVLIVICVLLAVLYYGKPEAIFPVAAVPHTESKVTPAVHKERVSLGEQPAEVVNIKALSGNGSADSLVLENGEYTIVLETFRLEQTARKERARLQAQDIVAYVWPGSVNGIKHYRLMTGKFLSRDRAVVHLKGLPKKIAGSAYIQQVLKKDVFYGEKGL